MTRAMRLLGAALLAALLLGAAGLAFQAHNPVQAASVANYYTYGVEDGSERYFAEHTTAGINVDGYGTALIGVGMSVKSVTTTFAITVQYAIPTSGLCTAAGLAWFDGEDTFDYAKVTGETVGLFTDTLTTTIGTSGYRTAFTQLMTLSGNANEGREFRIKGRCLRLVITPSSGYTQTFTPTVAVLAQDAIH